MAVTPLVVIATMSVPFFRRGVPPPPAGSPAGTPAAGSLYGTAIQPIEGWVLTDNHEATRNADFCVLVAFAGTNELVVTNVGRDDKLVAVVESQLVDFFNEAKEDGDLYPRNSAAAAELRLALRGTREMHVGDERAYRVSMLNMSGLD